MANINDLIRRTSTMVDTSGQYPAPAIQMVPVARVGGGVYAQNYGNVTDVGDVLSGRITLGIMAAFIAGAVGFYLWTREIQGGG
jgi:hypothetical protein